MNPLLIFLASIFTHNIALVYILGMCPFIAISKSMKTAVGMAVSVIFVTTLTAAINWSVYWLLLVPTHTEAVALIVYIIVIASVVQLLEMVIEKFFPPLQASFGIFLPLITVNCIVLAVTLFMVLRNYNFGQSVFFAAGTSAGWALAIIIMASIKEKMLLISDVPKGLRGPGITMMIAGILALSFLGFGGMITLK